MGSRKQRPKLDHDSVIAGWQQHAEKNDDKNFDFLHSLKRRDFGFDPSDIAAELHKQAFQIVDCTRCANCCRTATITLNQEDIDRIAAHLGMEVPAFFEKYLERDELEGRLRMRQKPCPLLGDDNRCTVYEVRPRVCREYPHTDKEGFELRTYTHAANTRMCPAVFWIVEQIRLRASRKAESS